MWIICVASKRIFIVLKHRALVFVLVILVLTMGVVLALTVLFVVSPIAVFLETGIKSSMLHLWWMLHLIADPVSTSTILTLQAVFDACGAGLLAATFGAEVPAAKAGSVASPSCNRAASVALYAVRSSPFLGGLRCLM